MMLPQRRGEEILLKCSKCGYEKAVSNPGAYRIARVTKRSPEDAILVIDREIRVEVLPKTKVGCPRCGHVEAYYWELQTRAGDEPATRFFKCSKCGHVWREYQ